MDRPACLDLHAEVLPDVAVKDAMLLRLSSFSPRIEPLSNRAAFCLDAAGVLPLFPSLFAWGTALRDEAARMGFSTPAVVVGFTKFAVSAAARASFGVTVLGSPETERAVLEKVPLDRMGLPEKALHRLQRLAVHTLKDLTELPATGLLARFGTELHDLHRHAAFALWDPLNPEAPKIPIVAERLLDEPETNTERLAFLARHLLTSLLSQAAARFAAVDALDMTLDLDHAPPVATRVKPAEPTLDAVQLADLLRLRLEGLPLSTGVTGLHIEARVVPITQQQIELFEQKPRRDKDAANRALARLKAEHGADAVVRAELRDGHLPEARFALVPFDNFKKKCKTTAANSETTDRSADPKTLVRRIFTPPVPLQTRPVVGPGGCHFLGMGDAPAVTMAGPFTLSGGWWRTEIHRDYYFAETKDGRVLWVYFDQKRRRWFLHGEVE